MVPRTLFFSAARSSTPSLDPPGQPAYPHKAQQQQQQGGRELWETTRVYVGYTLTIQRAGVRGRVCLTTHQPVLPRYHAVARHGNLVADVVSLVRSACEHLLAPPAAHRHLRIYDAMYVQLIHITDVNLTDSQASAADAALGVEVRIIPAVDAAPPPIPPSALPPPSAPASAQPSTKSTTAVPSWLCSAASPTPAYRV